ncbi:MAG: HEAT repeat domain-containing protein [Woeseiaceae bacterium]
MAQDPAALPDIREFVQQVYIHGVPYEVASRYDESVVPDLLEMLADESYLPHWSSIVTTLGMIGDESAVEPLIEFLQAGNAEASPPEYTARSNVLLALGYNANKSGSDTALSYLSESVDPSVWSGRNVGWSLPHMDAKGRDEQLSTMAILGLALSGRPAARDVLQDLQRPATAKVNREFAESVSDVVETALEDHELIAEKGLLHYTRREPGHEFEPVGIVTGAAKPPPIITGSDKVPEVPDASMRPPKLPPKPALREAPEILEGTLPEEPPPKER